MSRIRILSLMFAVMAAVVTGCGDNNSPPDNGTRNNLSVSLSALQWSFVDGNERYAGINPGAGGDNPHLAEFNSKLYTAWSESGRIRVAVYNGNDAAPAWSYVDNGPEGINNDPGMIADLAQLTVFNGKLYAIWQEATRIIVVVYSGDDNNPAWTAVGSYDDGVQVLPGINKSPATTPTLAVLGSKLYSSWTGTQAHIAVYNGNDASPSWKQIDGGGLNLPNNVGNSRIIAFSSKLYLAHYYNGGVGVTVFNGNEDAPQWTSVTGKLPAVQRYNPPPALMPTNIAAAVVNGKLYLAWREYVWVDNEVTGKWFYEMIVAVYNGSDNAPEWSFVTGDALYGINKDPLQVADGAPQLAVFGSTLVATWTEHLPDMEFSQVRIASYNGNDAAPAWSFIDNGAYGINFDPARNAYNPYVIAFNSKLYLTWREDYLGSQIRVAVGQ